MADWGRQKETLGIEMGLTGLCTSTRKSLLLKKPSVLWNQERRNTWMKNPELFLQHNKYLPWDHEDQRWLQLTHKSISTSEKIWSMPLNHFICQSHHLFRPTEKATACLTRSKADGVTRCWNTAVCVGTPGSVGNDPKTSLDRKGEQRQWETTEHGSLWR